MNKIIVAVASPDTIAEKGYKCNSVENLGDLVFFIYS